MSRLLADNGILATDKGEAMEVDQLIAEGRRLARPCVYLRTSGTEYAAVWGGKGVVPGASKPHHRHWISIDCRHLPQGARPGCLSLYTSEREKDFGTPSVFFATDAHLPAAPDGTALFAEPSSSLPPLEAVFLFGSPDVKKWLAANKWKPEWGYNPNFRDRKTADAYERVYHHELPFFTGTAHAVLGGWHMPWPEGDWEELIEQNLCLWTFADSEPWLEVWEHKGKFRAIERTT